MKYDKEKYKIWNYKSPVILHWIINPGLVINELILGQTIPKVMLIEREGKKPFYQRSLIPCPHCGTMHNGLKWSSQNKTAFKNWFGYYCDNCKEIIPVQRNLTSLIILIFDFSIKPFGASTSSRTERLCNCCTIRVWASFPVTKSTNFLAFSIFFAFLII